MSVTPDEERFVAQIEAPRDFYFFARYMFAKLRGYPWAHNHHHREIADALMAVFRGEVQNLLLNLPPRYSKTELAVIMFVAWCMGRVPDSEFIHTSYSSALAGNNAFAVRSIIDSEAYRDIFPDVNVRHDSKARDHWKTWEGGVMYSTSSGGPITGFGAGKQREEFGGAILIDDPHKADEARSAVRRQSVIDNYVNTVMSRRNNPKRTPTIVIMQRLHEKDLSGFLLSGGDGQKWEHVKIKAFDETTGKALWPLKHSADMLRVMQKATPYMFAGQMQQEPAPPGGGMFKVDMLRVIPAVPVGEPISWVRAWDFAASDEESEGDWTVGIKIGRRANGGLIVADVSRARAETNERDQMIKNVAARDGSLVKINIPQDPGAAGKAQVLYLTRMLGGYPVSSSLESGDKITRADPIASQVNVGNVEVVAGAWNDAFFDELRLFPNGEFDDQVDSLSRGANALMGSNTGFLDYLERLSIAQVAKDKASTDAEQGQVNG